MAALLAILYKIVPDRLTVWLALASIATAENLFYGQGAFLIAVLLGGGLLLVDDYPVLAGVLFSLVLNYKPHLGLLLPVALLAGAIGGPWAPWRPPRRPWPRQRLGLGAGHLAGLLARYPFDGAQLAEANLWDRMPTVLAASASGG